MRNYFILGAAVVALAACSDSGGADKDGDGEITKEEMEAEMKSGGAVNMQPGQYEVTTTFSKFEAPGLPEEAMGMIKAQLGKGNTITTCMTEEDVKDPGADFLGGDEDSCTFSEFDRSGSTMKVEMACDEQGMKMNSKMSGSFDSDGYNMDIDAQMSGSPMGDISMVGKVEGKRIGDCPAGEG